MLNGILNLVGLLGGLTFFAELVLFGRGSRLGERFANSLIGLSERTRNLRSTWFGKLYRWFRIITLILFVVVLGFALYAGANLYFWEPEPTPWDYDSSLSVEENLSDAFGTLLGDVIGYAFILIFGFVLLTLLVAFGLFVVISVLVLQVFLFGFRGHTPLVALTLGFMGSHIQGILTTSGAASSISSIWSFALWMSL